MGTLNTSLATAHRALASLEAALAEPYGVIVRDACLQRFEYTFEAVWKLLKVWLHDQQGIDVGSPKACFRETLRVGLLTAEQVEQLLLMTDDRNLTSHTYVEAVAQTVFSRIPGHARLMRALLGKLNP